MLIYSLAALAGLVLFALLARAYPPKPPKRSESDDLGEEVAITLAMEGIKGLTGGDAGDFLWAMVFLSALFAAAFLLGTRLREGRA